jgi:photosystem II stability/assembly factor-like uncharacterized protein
MAFIFLVFHFMINFACGFNPFLSQIIPKKKEAVPKSLMSRVLNPKTRIKMQKILLFLSLLVGMQHNAQAQQAWINKTPSIDKIAAFDANNAWFVAEQGRTNDPNDDYYSGLTRTTDGGTTWNFIKMLGYYFMSAPQLVSATEGWVMASDDNDTYLRKTTNGGTTWQNMFTNVNAFYFMSTSTGWVVDYYNMLRKTTDGGATWVTVSNLPSTISITNFKFTSATNGWLIGVNITAGETYIYATTDGGQTWSLKSTRPITSFYSFSNLDVLSSTEVWVTKKDSMFHTTDGGATWTATKHPDATQTYHTVSDLKFQSSSTGYTCVGSILYKTTDGGTTWINSGQGAYLAVTSTSTMWVSASAGVFKTTNGQSFVKQFENEIYRKVVPISSTEFYTLGNDYYLRKTNLVQGNCNDINSGHRCSNFTVTNNKLWTVDMTSSTQATVNTSNNGGASFTNLDTFSLNGANRRITEIAFVNNNLGTMSDNNNGIYTTTDGGTTWSAYTVTGQTSIRSLAFVANAADTAIYVVGNGGNIHKSTDKGATWTAQATGLTANLTKVFFLNPNQGWAVGENGTILRTTNGGTTWAAASTTNAGTVTLNSVHFTSASQGWAVGDVDNNATNPSGLILMSNDGGDTWTAQMNVSYGEFYNIHMFSATDGYAFNRYGIYRYANLPVAVQEVLTPEQAQNISLYPNPVHDQLTILNEGQANESTFRLLDQTGRQIISGKLNIGANQINVSELPAGMYFIQIQGAQKAYKVIKL